MTSTPPAAQTPKLAIALGWINGALLALLVDFAIYAALGDRYPQGPATLVLFAVFALAGSKVAERLGKRGIKPLAIAAGSLIALYIAIALAVLMSNVN